MARRRSSLAVVGGLLMAGSLFLPLWAEYTRVGPSPVYIFIFDPLNVGYAFELLGFQLVSVAMVAATVLSVQLRSTWAWMPAVLWLLWWAYLFSRLPDVPEGEFLRDHPAPWGWLAAFTGGGCVLFASLAERRRGGVRPLDVAVFD